MTIPKSKCKVCGYEDDCTNQPDGICQTCAEDYTKKKSDPLANILGCTMAMAGLNMLMNKILGGNKMFEKQEEPIREIINAMMDNLLHRIETASEERNDRIKVLELENQKLEGQLSSSRSEADRLAQEIIVLKAKKKERKQKVKEKSADVEVKEETKVEVTP